MLLWLATLPLVALLRLPEALARVMALPKELVALPRKACRQRASSRRTSSASLVASCAFVGCERTRAAWRWRHTAVS